MLKPFKPCLAGMAAVGLWCATTAWAQQIDGEPAPLTIYDSIPQAAAETADAASTEPEVIRERYPSTTIKVERTVILDGDENYINHGPWTLFNPRGEMVAHGDYRHGKRHGTWQRSFATGEGPMFTGAQFKEFERPFQSIVTFADGEVHGDWIVEDNKGRRMLEGGFEHGELTGKVTWSFASGKKRREASYKLGELDGTLLEWDEKAQLVVRETYLEGKHLKTEVQTHKGGVKSVEKSELHPVGKVVYNWMDGSAAAQVPPKNAAKELHGPATWWYTNGQKQLEGQYLRNVPVERFTWWYSNGQAKVQGDFAHGKPEGKWIWWHENGQKQMEGAYEAGDRSGKWSRWQTDGKVIAVEMFTAGVDTGAPSNRESAGAPDLSAPPTPLGSRPLNLKF